MIRAEQALDRVRQAQRKSNLHEAVWPAISRACEQGDACVAVELPEGVTWGSLLEDWGRPLESWGYRVTFAKNVSGRFQANIDWSLCP